MNISGNLPANLAWGAGTFGVIAALSWATNHYVLGEWRRMAGQHWTERARALARARFTGVINFTLFIFAATLVGSCFTGDDFPWAALVGGYLGATAAVYPVLRSSFPNRTVLAWLSSLALASAFRAFSLGLLVAGIFAMPRELGPRTWLIAGGWLGLQWALEYGLLLRILRLTGLLREPSARLAQVVRATSAWSGVAIRALWETPAATCRAVAFIPTRTLVFTSPLVEQLSDAEIEAICLQQLAALAESKPMVRRFIILGLCSRLPILFILPALAQFGASGPLVLLALYLGLRISLLRLRVRLGVRAQRVAVLTSPDPAVYARALEKIYRANNTPAVLSRRQGSYFNLYDRMVAAGVTPDFPRPLRPKRFHWTSAVLLLLVVAGFVLILNYG